MSRSVTILGVTGSVGCSTVDVIEQMRAAGHELPVEAITAGSNVEGLAEACRRLKPRFAAIADAGKLDAAREALADEDVIVAAGPEAVAEAAARPADWVMAAIVGAAGLRATLKAVERGALVALANKESLVCAGPLVMGAARASGATLLPVDSEHNAAFQVLTHPGRVERITLTGSGGPFRTWSREAMAAATPAQACNHPNFAMGAKISVDSATLMNKGLELIEAAWLFDLPADRLELVIHPQQLVHALVTYCDGSTLAQLGPADMRVAIISALAWPDRAGLDTPRLDLAAAGALGFEPPDRARFPALDLCRSAHQRGPAATAALNAANEVAVEAFLAGNLRFLDISRLVEQAMDSLERAEPALIAKSPSSLDEVEAVDQAARRAAQRIAGRLAAA